MKKQKDIYDICLALVALYENGSAFIVVAEKSVGFERLATLCRKAKKHVSKK